MDYDSLGRKKRISYPNKLETVFAFDDLQRLEEINTPNVGFRSYQYDELSNISRVKAESGQFDYAYDRNSSLIGAYYRGSETLKDEKFVWDASGNRLNGSRDPSGNSVSPRPLVINNGLFEDAEPMGEQVGRFSFIYDMHGNVVKKFDNQENIYYFFEYDADNKLVYAEKYKNDALVMKARYTFDGLGRRIEKEVTVGSITNRKSYIYNGDNILLEYNTSGASPIEVAKYIGTGEIDDNLMSIKNGKPYFYHKDHLGSIVAITNDAGETVQKNSYSSFGMVLSIKDKNRKEIGLEGAVEKSFAYTGREWDKEIGFYYYRNRSYDPQTGRFIQKDPIGLTAGDSNLYRSVKNNPLNFSDPLGLKETNPSDGAVVLNTDEGIEMLINSYVQEAMKNLVIGQNIYQVAHGNAQSYRNIASDNSLALSAAEHYLYTRGEVLSGGYPEAFGQIVSTSLYTPGKLVLENTPNTLLPGLLLNYKTSSSPASLTQMKYGYKGVIDGIQCK